MFLVLIEIINSIRVVSLEDAELLKVLIAEHHAMYIELCGPLKPKHHFMVHYPTLLTKVGPLPNIG